MTMSVSTDLWFHVVPVDLDGATLSKLVATYPLLIEALSKYQNQKSSKYKEDLKSLDHYRYEELPDSLKVRRDSGDQDGGSEYVELDELKRLLEWKMSRGVFRPSLRGLIASNSIDSVKTITGQAFADFTASNSSESQTPVKRIQQAVKTLCKPRGVGPATASLILSVAYPDDIPFFADELFTWVSFQEESMLHTFLYCKYPEGTGDGIEGVRTDKITGIKYTDAEYKKLCLAVLELKERLSSESAEASAADIEKASFVILQGLEALCIGAALREPEDTDTQKEGVIDAEAQSQEEQGSRDASTSAGSKTRSSDRSASKTTNGKRRISRSQKEDVRATTKDSKRRKVLPS